jgi:hypothetical protein
LSAFETSAPDVKNLCARFLNAQRLTQPIRMVGCGMGLTQFLSGIEVDLIPFFFYLVPIQGIELA